MKNISDNKCNNRHIMTFVSCLLILSMFLSAFACIYSIPSSNNSITDITVSALIDQHLPQNAMLYTSLQSISTSAETVSKTYSSSEKNTVYVGGIPFGVRFSTDGVMVTGFGTEIDKFKNPAYLCGIRPADLIIGINGQPVRDITTFIKLIESSDGQSVNISLKRSGNSINVNLKPYLSPKDNKYKSGLAIRDGGAGIGTVTYFMPETGGFGGLGHGICDSDTGCLLPIKRGTVNSVTINGAKKGQPGNPGELKGIFKNDKLGSMTVNTSCGVFGLLTEYPVSQCEQMAIGSRSEVKCGDAYIICTTDQSGPQKYKVSISEIDRNAKGNKCYSIKIIDPDLLEKTGGIVQGMSGSPVIQNGKLIGAVTHVLINDPTCGYGIFIDNMLSSMPEMLVS